MLRRRALISALTGALVPPLFTRRFDAAVDFAAIERRVAGRLGVAVLDTHSGRRLGHRIDERFPMCSTFKWLLAAQALSRIEAGQEKPDRFLTYGERDLLPVSPVTRENLARGGLPVLDLAAAAVSQSDNTAANLLLAAGGGPSGLTRYLRDLGDSVTRLDRMELELNEARPGDPRDTTTPAAMLEDMNRLLVGDALGIGSRARLLEWLVATVTGAEKIRAGLPSTWRVGDKTGMCGNGSTNDIAIAWPPGRKPVLIAAYLTETRATASARNGALAEVARQAAAWVT